MRVILRFRIRWINIGVPGRLGRILSEGSGCLHLFGVFWVLFRFGVCWGLFGCIYKF